MTGDPQHVDLALDRLNTEVWAVCWRWWGADVGRKIEQDGWKC